MGAGRSRARPLKQKGKTFGGNGMKRRGRGAKGLRFRKELKVSRIGAAQ